MRYTTYHCGKAVINDKNKLSEAMDCLSMHGCRCRNHTERKSDYETD